MKSRFFTLLLACLLLLPGCVPEAAPAGGKLQVVATLFPQFDFARRIAGERAEVSLLLPAGVESHSYEPSPADIIRIGGADLFLYTGPAMEPWAQSIIEGTEGVRALDVSAGIALDEADGGDGHGHGEGEHVFDPHIWTSPQNAARMADNILEALCQVDPEGEALYRANAQGLADELSALDRELREMVGSAARREIVFAGRFAFHYFAKDYGITYTAAYDSCSSETEPSAQAVARIIEKIRADGIPAVYHEELVDPKVARAIAEETGAEVLLLHSCHNISREDMENGETYLTLMRRNAENLRKGLN